MIHISAANLIKSSLKQMLYIHYTNKERIATPGQLAGNDHAYNVANNMIQEKRGTLRCKDFNIYFTIDAITADIAIEIKHITRSPELWMLHSSIMQSSFYASLLKYVNYLDTPAFRLSQGYKQERIELNDNPIRYYVLMFGDDKYIIEPSSKVFNHYLLKASLFRTLALKKDFTYAMNKATEWDSEYKFKENNLYIDTIKFTKIKSLCSATN
jgi:hypothetical protein